jgi:membrane-associated phospholipid phosphatase
MSLRKITLFVLFATPCFAQDTVRLKSQPLFGSRDAWYAAGFVGGTLAMAPFDQRIAHWFQRPSLQNDPNVERGASLFRWTGDPGALIIGGAMYGTGRVLGLHRVADLGLHGTEAIIVGGAIASAVKMTAGRARPYVTGDGRPGDFGFFRGFHSGTAYQSFPSGHTLAAFAAASAVTAETSSWWPGSAWVIGPTMYGGATMVGISRMYNDKHWASDVVLGAAIGTFSGIKVVKYQHTHQGNRLDRWLLSATPVVRSGEVGMNITY